MVVRKVDMVLKANPSESTLILHYGRFARDRLMSEYDFIFETPYNIPKGTAYPCTIDRPKDQRKQVFVSSFFLLN